MKPKYGEQISIGELYNRNKELQKDNTVDTSVNLNNEFLKASQKSARYGTPVNQPIGQMFAPYGGVKKIDEKLTEQDLYNIPEGRAEAQSGWKLAGNFIGQLATETLLGMPEVIGYTLDFEELYNADKQAQEGFDNEFSKYFREAKNQIQEEWFPVYRTERSFSDSLWERLGDPTWIASQGKTLGTTLSLMLPSLAIAYATGGVGLGAMAPIAAAMFSRKAESAMEAVGTFESEYNQYLAEGKSDKEARELAGQTAAGIFKANAAMLPVDMMQYALGMKAFSGVKAAMTIPGKTIAGKAANLGVQMGSEALEESYQSIAAEEHIKAVRENIDPFGVGFSERLGDYIKDPDIQEAALLGALSGGIFEGGSRIANKAYEKYQNHAAGKAITQQFNDKSTFDKIDNQIEADLLTRSAKHDKFDTYINTATAYNEKVQSDENITPEEKQQVAEKTKKIIENATFVKQAKEDIQNINEDYKEAPNLSTQYALNKFHDKIISDEITKLSQEKKNFYKNLSDRKDKAFIHTLEISALERQNENLKKDKKLDPEYKELLIKDNEAKIAKFKENLNDLNERIKETEPSFNPDEYSVPFAVIGEFVQNAYLQAALENKKTMFRKEIAKAEKKTLKQLKEEEEAIQQSKEEEVVKDATEKAETSDPVKTSKEASRSKNPKVKDAVDNTINKKATDEFTPDETPDLDFVNFAKDRYTNAPNSFVKEKQELKEKLQSLSKKLPDNTYLSDILAAFDEADTPESLDVLINHAKNNEEVFSNIVDFFDVKNKSKVNVLPKEESVLNALKTSQETNVDNNPSDENTIEPEFLTSSSESHNESNRGYQWSEGEFHVNLNYKFDKTKKGYNVVTEENNLFTLIGVNDAFLNSNDLKPGDTVTATYDPNLSFTLKRKEYTNKDRTKFKYIEEQVTNAELVAQGRWKEVSIILESQGEVLNVLFTYNANQQDLLIPIKKQVVENGSQDFTIKNKFGGMLYLHQKADNTLSNINDYRKKMGVDSIQMGIIKIHKHIPYIDSPTLNKQLPLPFRGRPGQVVLLLENGAGSYIPYPLITRRLIEGENTNALENTSLENNEVFKRVLDNIKSIKENKDNWEKVNEDVSLKVYYDENKKTKEKYYVINPANISEDTINMLQRAGITVLSKKEDANMYKHYFKVDADTFDNIELQEYAEDTVENAVLSFLGNLKLQITVEDIQNTDKWEQISRRTKTNLDNKAVVNTSFTIMTDATPEVKNTTPIKSEATTPKVEDTSDFENYDAEAAREVEETFERNNAEVDDIVDPTSDIGDIIVDEEITGEGQIKSGVSELFESNSELANIGTQEQYSSYLETIFPDSKVKDIVYHGTDTKFDKFDYNYLPKADAGFYFTKDKKYAENFGNPMPVLLHVVNPNYTEEPLSTETVERLFTTEYKESTDSVIGKDAVLDLPQSDADVIVIMRDNQVHILGSEQDIEGFKEFVGKPVFDKELAQKIQDKLQKLYPEIKLNITNNPIWEQGDNVFNQEEYNNQVNYRLKATETLLSDKAKQVFKKGEKNGWDLNKILTELQIPKEQKQLILNSGITDREQLSLELTSKYSFTIEINTAKGTAEFIPADEDLPFDGYSNDSAPKGTPTQYYSKLTVPGGTNYTENEISTPLITPSIKGHAQFSTDNGIGWFRSDEQVIQGKVYQQEEDDYGPSILQTYDGIPTKTRRVLEVQSDLFQKGRSKKDLTKIEKLSTHNWMGAEARIESFKEMLATGEVTQEEYDKEVKQIKLDKEKINQSVNKNQFLQLLNKNNNWVAFFVKSIIQDSAKKGYEKVLFPLGDTAAKIEGHQTLEEFKRQKEARIKELKSEIENSGKIIDSFESKGVQYFIETPYGKSKETILDNEGNYITKDVTTYFKIDNTTKEEYLKGEQKISVSEYRNAAKEANVNIDYYKLTNEQIINKKDEIKTLKQELADVESGQTQLSSIAKFYEETITNILKKQGYNPVEITDEYGNAWNKITINQARDLSNILLQRNEANQIIGQANIKAMTVLVDAINQKQDTLPHEYAHHYIAWFRNTPIVQEAIKKWGSEEALVQSIGEQVVKQKGEAYNWWNNFVKWIMNQFNSLSKLQKEELTQILTDAFLTRRDLGSKQDIEGFKEFVGKETTETGVKTNLKPSSLFDIKSNEPQDSGTDVIDDSDADIDILFDSTSKYEPFKPIDLEKEKAWLNKNVPNLTKEDGTDLIASLQGMSRRVFAAFKDGIIYLSKDSREGSAYHEAFHSVFYTYLTPKEQRVIYREAAMLFGSRDKLTLQEALADTFREYVLDGDDTFVYPYKGIKKFFHTIRNFIVSNIFGQPTIEQLFNRINTGYYASKPVSEEIKDKLQGLLLTDARVREMTPSKQSSRENTLLATLSLVIDADLKKQTDYQHINRADFLTREMDAKNAEFFSNWIDYYMLKALKTLEKARDNYSETKGKEWTDEMNVFINNSLYYNKENKKIVYKGIGLGALHKLASREGIKLKLDQIIKSEEINLDSKGLIEEETKIDGWQIQVTQTSGKLGLSNEIRKQLSYIKTGKQDDLGFAEYMNFEEAYATMKVKLSDSYNVDTMMEKLEKYSKIDSSFGPLYNTLTAPGNETLKTKFFIDFAKSHSNYKRVFQTKDGKIVVSDSNGAFIRNVVLDEIRTSLYEQGYYNQEGEIIPEMADKAAHIKTAQEFNDFFKLNLPEEAIKEIPDTNVERIITNLKNNEDIFTGSLMKSLAKTVGYYRRDLLESSFMNVEGETVYSHIVPNFVAKQISKIKDAFAIDNLKKRNAAIQDLWDFYNTDPFYKNSPLFKTIFEMKDKDLVNNLEYALIDGMIWNAKNRGISYTDMSDKEFLATSINMWFNSDTKGYGWYQSPILSDAPTGLFIKLRKYSETDIIDKLYQVALQEYARIQDTSKSDVKFYDDNKNTFFFLDLQASDMKLSSTEIKQKIKDNLQKDYENFLQYATDSDLFNAEDNFGLDVRMLGDIPSFFDPFSKSYKKSYDVSAALGKDSHRKALSRHLREYYYNSVFATSQIITLTTGDPAYYKSVGDFYKRSKEIWSPAQVLDVNASFNYEGEPFTVGQTYSSVYVNDIEVVSNIAQDFWNDYEKTGNIESAKLAAQYGYSNTEDGKFVEIKYEGKDIKFKSSKVNVADAQTFITPQRARAINIGLGRWNKEKHKVLNKIINNEPLTPEDYNFTFDIYKPFYFGHSKIDNKVFPVQNKNSEYMLTPALVAKSPTLQKIYNVMQERNIDSISFESVVKVGLNNAISWEDLQEGKFEKVNIQKLNNSDFGIQQEVPEHYLDAKNLIGSQIRKHILANLNLEGNYVVGGKEIPAKEMIDLTHSIFETNLKEDYDKTIVDLGLDGAEIDYSKLVEILEREIVSRDLGLDLLEAVELNPITGKPNLHLSDPLHKDRNEKLVNSIFKNRITKQKIKGGPMVQVSSVGFMESLRLERNSDNTRLEYAECMLPWSSKKFFEPFMDDRGEINISDVPEELLKMVGYRIPTEDKYSMLPLKVVGFLPQHAGGAIILPLEITTIAGSDFDVDKMYAMMPEFNTRYQWDFDKLIPELKEQGFLQINKGQLAALLKKINAEETLTDREIEIYDSINLLPEQRDFQKITGIYKATNMETRKGRNNKLIDIMFGVLTNEHTYKQLITPGGFDNFKNNVNLIYLVSKGGKYETLVNKTPEELEKLVEEDAIKEGINLTSPLSQVKMFNRNMTGKKLVGIFANHNASHSILQHTNIEFTSPIVINGKEYSSLHNVLNDQNGYISRDLAEFLAAVVDNAKDPNAFKGNINTYTADVLATMIRVGVPMQEAIALLRQPIIVKLSQLYYKHGGNFAAEDAALEEMRQILGKEFEAQPVEFSNLLSGLNDNLLSYNQFMVLQGFLNIKEKSQSLVMLMQSMRSDTDGAGPNMADNEIIIRKQRKILLDENLKNVGDIFDGKIYKSFKAFNDYGVILPHNQAKRLFPLANTTKESLIDYGKTLFENSISKEAMNVKEINRYEMGLLTYIASNFDFFKDNKDAILDKVPATFNKYLKEGKLDGYMIKDYVKYVKDDKFKYGRLEFNNTGAVTPTLKADIKDSLFQMFFDESKDISRLALGLIKYNFHKEGYLFGPKSFNHLNPTRFFLELTDGVNIKDLWYKIFESQDLSLTRKQIEDFNLRYLKNNWKNSNFVPEVNITENNTVSIVKQGDLPIAFKVTSKSKQFTSGKNFIKLVKFKIKDAAGKTDFILFEAELLNEYSAVYKTTNKSGKFGQLVELNMHDSGLKSILAENNKYVYSLPKSVENNLKSNKPSSIIKLTPEQISKEEENRKACVTPSKTKKLR